MDNNGITNNEEYQVIKERENKEKKMRKELRDSDARNRAKNFIIAILLATTIFGAYQLNRANTLRRQLDNSYNRAFHELVGYVQNVELMLMKARLASSSEMAAEVLHDVWREASSASSTLTQLPISLGVISNTKKFLTQVSDLSRVIARQSALGMEISEEQEKTLAELHKLSVSLENSLSEMHQDLISGNLKWENVAKEETKEMKEASENMPVTFSNVNSEFEKMPTLIYDGPFSEHMQNRKALGLTGEKVTENQAITNLHKFLGKDRVENVQKLSDNNNGIIDTYNFRVALNGNNKSSNIAEADVSVKGGHVIWFLHNREVGEKTIDVRKAMEIGAEFLKERGFENMKQSYYLNNDGIATINYAYHENGITYYPDLIKVKVALDNGDVVGFEANGYFMNHRDRNLEPPTLTEEEARQLVRKGENIKSSGLAVIPTNYGTELLCYEFTGKLEDRDFLVYINAYTGKEEQVLIIINSEEGILTM
ncbi:MAG TPA: germination protein YpeB [Clostridiales bacterium]|nr:germination protein YpeB [Clostridiales bacterium]